MYSEEYNPMVNNINLDENEKRARRELSYEWVAYYNDGSILRQYDDINNVAHHFGHIEQDKIKEFEILPTIQGLFPLKVNLYNGLFYINNNPVLELKQHDSIINLGFDILNKKIESTWGDKAKLIYFRHVRRNFVPGLNGFDMDVSIVYEIGWEAIVDGEHHKHTINIDDKGIISIPESYEDEGFKPL
jgi:hypothetical protein